MENYNVNYSVHLPSYSIGPDCYNEVPYVTRFFGKTAVVLGGETAMEKAKPAQLKGVEGSDVELLGFLPYGGDSTYEIGDAIIANPLVQKADLIFAMGGGRACDTGKYVADKLDKLCPTCRERYYKNPLRILDCKEEGCKALCKDAPKIVDYLCDDCSSHFKKLQELLTDCGVSYFPARRNADVRRRFRHGDRTPFNAYGSRKRRYPDA